MQTTPPSPSDPAPESFAPTGKLDLAAAKSFHAELLSRAGGNITLDLSGVTHMGALCAQICLSAARTLQANGHSLQLTNTPDTVTAHLTSMGLSAETLATGAP